MLDTADIEVHEPSEPGQQAQCVGRIYGVPRGIEQIEKLELLHPTDCADALHSELGVALAERQVYQARKTRVHVKSVNQISNQHARAPSRVSRGRNTNKCPMEPHH